ncbi:hypothetical protein SAMN05421774_11262 [Gemmobacter megaterium]|uniref:Calcineurin-like phosphoesterase n=1 Tax=Gemmobacter megaterium TaxID=1086013 RepID=A0A1N7QIP9_9RHOB|nr:pyocin knob domain-containing protein [Gemmobacter megaterium]GGE26548.1 hypothetical protein GCM10011345_35650 [Gemmobacter megaterium]SIT22770.1 hypothetical protein SAMN05421774_11262 [Gemmobacter megaterium]
MPMLLTRITGPVDLPNGETPRHGRVHFQLRDWDRTGDHLIMPREVVAQLDAMGWLDVRLQTTTTLDRGSIYDVAVQYWSVALGRQIVVQLPGIAVPASGPVTLASLLAIPAPVPDVPDALAQAIAAKAAAEAAAVSAAASATFAGGAADMTKGRRTRLRAIVTGDWQPKIGDPLMPPGQENSQFGILERVLDSMGAQLPAADLMLHVGDIGQRLACSTTNITTIRAAGLDPDEVLQPGDPYPWGMGRVLPEVWGRARISLDRFFAVAGNHDVSGRGGKTNPRAWMFDDFREVFGRSTYAMTIGRLGFMFMSTESGGVGGQIPRDAVDYADRVMRAHPYHFWHIVIHQPPVGYGPEPNSETRDPVTVPSAAATSWAGGGQPLVTVGAYAYGSEAATQVFLGEVEDGVLLTYGVDYAYADDAGAPPEDDTLPPEGEEGADDDTPEPAPPYTDIRLLQTWQHGPITDETVLQLRIAYVKAALDFHSTQLVLGTPSDPGLIRRHADRIFAVFYGHTGIINSYDQTPTRYDADLDLWWVCNNMAIPRCARAGIDGTDNPLIWSVADWDTDSSTLTFRRWNATADEVGGEWVGAWLSDTHPGLMCDFQITYPGQLDLGDGRVTFDGRRQQLTDMDARHILIRRDIDEAPGRRTPGAPDEAGWPTFDREGGSSLEIARLVLEDKALNGIVAGDGMHTSVSLARGATSSLGGRVAWQRDATREVMQAGYEHATGSDGTPRARAWWSAVDVAGVWRRVFEIDGDTGRIRAPGGVEGPLEISVPAISIDDAPVAPQAGLKLDWREGGQNLGAGEGVSVEWTVTLLDDPAPVPVGRIAMRKVNALDASRLSELAFQLSEDGAAVPRDVLVVDPVTGRFTGPGITQTSTDATAGRLSKAGDYGWGALATAPANIGSWLRTDAPSGVYVFGATTTDQTDMPPGYSSGNFGTVVVERFSPTFFTLRAMRAGAANPPETWTRRYMNGTWGTWHQVRNTANTTVDSNGFVKAASPIARVGGGVDPDQGFAAAGDGAVNAMAAGVTITRVGLGVYMLGGSHGLAQSGWQIEVPRDHNGNRLVHVATTWADGVLIVTLTAPVWDDGLWIAGDPMDAPGGRWVDVRLHQPEPEPETEPD